MNILRYHQFNESKNTDLIGFSIYKVGNISTLTLIELTTEKILGTISLRKVINNFEVVAIVAEKGRGYLLLQVAMMHVFNKGLMSSRDANIKPQAIKLWEKCYGDVDIMKLPCSFTNEYSQEITDLCIDEFDDINNIDSSELDDDEMMIFTKNQNCKHVKLNFIYKKEQNDLYFSLLENNSKYLNKSDIYYYKLGNAMFQDNYNLV